MPLIDIGLIRTILNHSSASGIKSTVLKSLGWIIPIEIVGLIVGLNYKASSVIIIFIIFLCLTVLLFIGTFIYCLFSNPDLLRSESFTLTKLAIEKGIYGDNLSGEIKEDMLQSLTIQRGDYLLIKEVKEDKK